MISSHNIPLGIALALVVASHIAAVLSPSWESVVCLFLSFLFAAFIFWFNPNNEKSVKLDEHQKLSEQVESLQAQVRTLNMKFGFINK